MKKLMMLLAGAVFCAGVGFAEEPVAYLDWDGEKLVPVTCTEYEVVTNGANAFAAGKTYVVKGEVSTANRIIVEGTTESPTRLILCDGAKLTASQGLSVVVNGSTTNALVICGQQGCTGVLDATGGSYAAGIGGANSGAGGTVVINGGSVTATGGSYAAGIGGGSLGAGGTVMINGGIVTATGGFEGAGIGSGSGGGQVVAGGTVMINGGVVTATGGKYGAGIGGGWYGTGGTVVINGGVVTATGGTDGAGIGGGWYGTGGTVMFGEDFKGGILAGDDAARATIMTADAYAKDHGAKYVTMPVAVLMIPMCEGCTCVVSNGVGEVEAVSTDGTNIYMVTRGDTVKVYFAPAANYRFVGDFTNPMDIGEITELVTVVDKTEFPPVELIPVDYLDWDGEKLVSATCTEYEIVTNGVSTFAAGKTYVVFGEVSTSSRVAVNGTTENPTYLILCDGAKLTALQSINVTVSGATTNALVIYGQQGGTGALNATCDDYGAGIGGGRYGTGGMVTINGGKVTAQGDYGGAGIGGGYNGAGGTVTINGGTVTATGGDSGAGIGGGDSGGAVKVNGGTVTINGGTVTAQGGTFAAGIGGGWCGAGGTVTINGGMVTATGGDDAAGIGGYRGAGGSVTINGGVVTAQGGEKGAGIGGGSGGAGGTLRFAEVVPFAVLAGDSAPGSYVPIAAFVEDHTARYVHVESGKVALTLEGIQGYQTIASNAMGVVTNVSPDLCCRVYVVTTGETVTVTFVLEEKDDEWGIVPTTNPMTCKNLTENTVVPVEDLPQVRRKPVPYLNWDPVGLKMTNAVCTAYEKVTFETTAFGAGMTYVVTGGVVEVASRIAVEGTVANPTRLILCDDATLTANAGINVTVNGATTNALVICGQQGGTGALDATGGEYAAGIGGGHSSTGGTVTINGGVVTVQSGSNAAGIGGGIYGAGGTVTINGGTVTAQGGAFGAGIGGGYKGAGGTVTINGGIVTATGGYEGAGVGGGDSGGAVKVNGGTVTINGGMVTATGGYGGAGIGGGSSGGAEKGNGGVVTINGGTVTAQGGYRGAGIGGGYRGAGGTVTIRNGAVKVVAGELASVVGHGNGNDDDGSVSVSGGIFAMTVENSWLMERNRVIDNPDPATKGDYPYQVITLYKLTIPQVEHATVEVKTNGAVVAGFAGSIDVLFNSMVRVAFMADPGYRVVANGEKEWSIVCDVTFGTMPGFPLPTIEGIPGTQLNPWQVGADVIAYTNANGVLTIAGTGAMDDFATPDAVPWDPETVVMVTVDAGVTYIGANALTRFANDVMINGIPVANYRLMATGFAPAPEPTPVPPAGAVTTWAALTNAVATYPTPTAPEGSATMGAESGAVIAVGADINEPDGVLTIAKGQAVTILLYGKVVSCQKVVVEGALTVGAEDDSVGKIVAAEGAKLSRTGSVVLLGGPIRGTFTSSTPGLAMMFR